MEPPSIVPHEDCLIRPRSEKDLGDVVSEALVEVAVMSYSSALVDRPWKTRQIHSRPTRPGSSSSCHRDGRWSRKTSSKRIRAGKKMAEWWRGWPAGSSRKKLGIIAAFKTSKGADVKFDKDFSLRWLARPAPRIRRAAPCLMMKQVLSWWSRWNQSCSNEQTRSSILWWEEVA